MDAFKAHVHTIQGERSGFAGGDGSVAGMYRIDGHYPMTNGAYSTGPAYDGSRVPVADSETRPKNIALYYYIRVN